MPDTPNSFRAGPDEDGDDNWENENNIDSAYQFAEVLTSS